MYSQNMMRVYRSPEAGEGGGAAAAPAAGAGGADASNQAAASGGAAGSTQAEYLSKSDFEAFRQEIGGHLSRLTPRQQAAEEKADAKDGAPAEPDVTKYDFSKPGELSRYNRDNYKYLRALDRQEETREAAKKATEERLDKSRKGHVARVAEYRKENPTFDEDTRKFGRMDVENEVSEAVFECEESAAIVHYFTKHPGTHDELNQLALMGNTRAIDRRIGEIVAEIRAEKKTLEANAAAAADKPPRQNFTKGSKGAKQEPTMEERYNDFRS